MKVLLLTFGAVQVDPPMETVAPAMNPVPVIVTIVPPNAFPVDGVTEVMVGTAL